MLFAYFYVLFLLIFLQVQGHPFLPYFTHLSSSSQRLKQSVSISSDALLEIKFWGSLISWIDRPGLYLKLQINCNSFMKKPALSPVQNTPLAPEFLIITYYYTLVICVKRQDFSKKEYDRYGN